MTQLLLRSGLLLDLAHRTAEFTDPAIVLHAEGATGGFPATDVPAVLAALDAGATATFRDESDRSTLASVTVTPGTLTLRLDEEASTLPLTPEDRHALADAIRATQLSPCEFVS